MEFGDEVRDQVTGFGGTVTGRCEYITGCARFLVQPAIKGGLWRDAQWFDEQRLVVVSAHRLELVQTEEQRIAGGDVSAPVK